MFFSLFPDLCLETNVVSESFASNGSFSGTTVLALSKMSNHNLVFIGRWVRYIRAQSPKYPSGLLGYGAVYFRR
jgi:hypothetical protein